MTKSLITFFLSSISQDERKEDKQQVLIPGTSAASIFFPGCVTQEGLCIGRQRSLLAHWVRQVECFLCDAWLSKWAQFYGHSLFYNVVCMIIFISSEREHVSHGTAEGAFLKNHLNIKTTDFEGVKTRWPWKPDMFTSVAFLWDVLFL